MKRDWDDLEETLSPLNCCITKEFKGQSWISFDGGDTWIESKPWHEIVDREFRFLDDD